MRRKYESVTVKASRFHSPELVVRRALSHPIQFAMHKDAVAAHGP
jgi:hypothetical protein